MKILLAGASGLVGAAFARAAAAAGHEVIGVIGRWSETVPGAAGVLARDLADAAQAAVLVAGVRPDVIVNAAAISEPAACLADPVRSHRINVEFPAALARAAADAGVRLVHLSSEQVFDGEGAPYSPSATPRPLNLYGEQKRAAEEQVLASYPAAAAVRLPLLFGHSLGGRRSVHEKLFEQWAAGKPARLYRDEVRQVCSAESVASALLRLGVARPDLAGMLHWAGAESVSRWEMGQAIARHFGVADQWLVGITRADTPEVAAQRPRDLSLTVAGLDRELQLPLERFAAAVAKLQRPPWAAGRRL